MAFRFIYVWVIFALCLVSCATNQSEPILSTAIQIATETQTPQILESTPTADPETVSGTATVVGRVFDEDTKEPLMDTIIRLAEVVRKEGSDDGVYVLDQAFSPGTRTDEEGVFSFENVEVMEYVVVVGNVEDLFEVVHDEAGLPKVWKAEAGEVLDVGELYVSLKPTQE